MPLRHDYWAEIYFTMPPFTPPLLTDAEYERHITLHDYAIAIDAIFSFH
jgi:hypothetical protein